MLRVVLMSVIFYCCYVECYYAQWCSARCRGVLKQVNGFNSNGIDKLLKPLDAPKLRSRLYHRGHGSQNNDTQHEGIISDIKHK